MKLPLSINAKRIEFVHGYYWLLFFSKEETASQKIY